MHFLMLLFKLLYHTWNGYKRTCTGISVKNTVIQYSILMMYAGTGIMYAGTGIMYRD